MVIFLGHLAAAVAAAELTGSDRSAAIAGTLLPDVIDKTGGWVLQVMPASRWLAHGLPFFTVVAALTLPTLPSRTWRGFVLGHASHLATDLYAGGRVPWFAPFESPPPRRNGRLNFPAALLEEAVGAAFLWWRFRWTGASSRAQGPAGQVCSD
jgi:hypothetical protein